MPRRTRDLRQQLIVISWRDIPAQVVVRRGRERVPIVLPERFQKAIDRAAALAGKVDFDDYLQEWREEVEDCEGDPEMAARTRAMEIEAAFDDDVLAAIVRRHGRRSD